MFRDIAHWHLKLITFLHLSLIGFKECSLEDNFGDGTLIKKREITRFILLNFYEKCLVTNSVYFFGHRDSKSISNHFAIFFRVRDYKDISISLINICILSIQGIVYGTVDTIYSKCQQHSVMWMKSIKQ